MSWVSSRRVDVVTLRDQMVMVTVARFSHWFFTAMAGNKAGKKNQSSSTYFCFYASPIMALGGARYFVQRNTILSLTLPEKFGAKSQSLAGERAKELWFSFVTICYDFGQFKTLSVNIYCSRALCKEKWHDVNAFLLTKMRYSDSAVVFLAC